MADSERKSVVLIQVLLNKNFHLPVVKCAHFPFVIGRSSECDLVLEDDRASRQHAQIEERDGEFWIADLKSRHGLWMADGAALSESRLAADGIEIRIGKTRLKIWAEELHQEEEAPEPEEVSAPAPAVEPVRVEVRSTQNLKPDASSFLSVVEHFPPNFQSIVSLSCDRSVLAYSFPLLALSAFYREILLPVHGAPILQALAQLLLCGALAAGVGGVLGYLFARLRRRPTDFVGFFVAHAIAFTVGLILVNLIQIFHLTWPEGGFMPFVFAAALRVVFAFYLLIDLHYVIEFSDRHFSRLGRGLAGVAVLLSLTAPIHSIPRWQQVLHRPELGVSNMPTLASPISSSEFSDAIAKTLNQWDAKK